MNIQKTLYSSTTRVLIFQYSYSYVQYSPQPWWRYAMHQFLYHWWVNNLTEIALRLSGGYQCIMPTHLQVTCQVPDRFPCRPFLNEPSLPPADIYQNCNKNTNKSNKPSKASSIHCHSFIASIIPQVFRKNLVKITSNIPSHEKKLATVTAHCELTVSSWWPKWSQPAVTEPWPSHDWAVIILKMPWLSCDCQNCDLAVTELWPLLAVIIGPRSRDHRGHRKLTVTIYLLMGCQ